MITKGLAYASLFVGVLSLAVLFWSFQTSKKLAQNEDSTDNIFTRFVLFFAIIAAV